MLPSGVRARLPAEEPDRVFEGSLPLALATLAGGFPFVCCVGRDREGRFAPGNPRAHTQQAIDSIGALIEAAGGTLRDVVKCAVYVTDRAHWQPMNEVYFANFAVWSRSTSPPSSKKACSSPPRRFHAIDTDLRR